MVFCSIWLEMTVPKTCLNIRARNDFARQNHCIRWFHKSFRNPWNHIDLVSWDLNSVFSSFWLKWSLIEPWKQYLTLYLNDAMILTKVSVRQNHCVAISQAKVSYKQRIPVNFAGNHSGTEFFIQESNIQAFSWGFIVSHKQTGRNDFDGQNHCV